MKGDRHWRTSRKHNVVPVERKSNAPTDKQRKATLHAIGNRGVTNEFEAAMKITVQEKIAELERRIVSLETTRNQEKRAARAAAQQIVNPEPELGRVWKAFDALFAKVFPK